MIINSAQSDVEVIGDIKEFKTGIDPKNLEFITTLLSSNLYSSPEQSFIREIVSNAWDSQVEAGTTDVPVIVQITDTSVTIRDYGTGLSPERFKEVYCNIGSSTKRDTNDFIGGFGIGKYSSLACSNTAYITSYYNGKKYYYIMVKSGNSITTNLVSTTDTTEKNGVEVSIRDILNTSPFLEAMKYIVFFPNVYLDNKCSRFRGGISNNFNDVKIKRYKNYACANISIDNKILLGNVLYPLHNLEIENENAYFLSKLKYSGIVFTFDVGELNITPNRESIIYTSDTISKIKNKIEACKKEIENYILPCITKDFDNIFNYIKSLNSNIRYDYIENKLSEDSWGGNYINYSLSELNLGTTYKGLTYNSDIGLLNHIYNSIIPCMKGLVTRDRIYTGKVPWRFRECEKMSNPSIILVDDKFRFLSSIKDYLKIKYPNYAVVTKMTLNAFIDEFKFYNNVTYVHFNEIVKAAYNDFYSRAIKIDFNTDKDYLKYKESHVKEKGEVKSGIVYLYEYPRYSSLYIYSNRVEFPDYKSALEYIKTRKYGVILDYKTIENDHLASIASCNKISLITARKDVINSLKAENLTNVVDKDYILYKHPDLLVVASILKVTNKSYELLYEEWEDVRSTIPEYYYNEISKVLRTYGKYKESNTFINHVKNLDLTPDPYIVNIVNKLLYYSENYRKVRREVEENGIISNAVVNALLIKEGKYRVSYNVYRNYKSNKIIQTLCKR